MNRETIQGIKLGLASALLIALQLCLPAYAEDKEPTVTPYRPTVSNPADLSEPGWIELEMGMQSIKGGSDKMRDSVPLLAKLAFTDNLGILLGSEAGVRRTDSSDAVSTGNGDTTLLLKYRIPTATEGTAWGVEAGYKAPTAPDTIGSGKTDYIINGIYSTTFWGHVLDLNLGATKLGAVAAGEGDTQYNWAAAVSHELKRGWGAFGELSGNARSNAAPQAQLMAGATYNWSKRVVLDAGMAWGLNKASQDYTAFAGLSVLLGKLW